MRARLSLLLSAGAVGTCLLPVPLFSACNRGTCLPPVPLLSACTVTSICRPVFLDLACIHLDVGRASNQPCMLLGVWSPQCLLHVGSSGQRCYLHGGRPDRVTELAPALLALR